MTLYTIHVTLDPTVDDERLVLDAPAGTVCTGIVVEAAGDRGDVIALAITPALAWQLEYYLDDAAAVSSWRAASAEHGAGAPQED